MKTKNQLKAFLGLGALSLLTATLGGATIGCVADRPSRNAVFDENQYIRKDFLVRAGDATSPDYGWLLKATITDASEPNVFGDANVYQLFAGAHSDGELVHFVITSDNLTMVDNRQISSDPSRSVSSRARRSTPGRLRTSISSTSSISTARRRTSTARARSSTGRFASGSRSTSTRTTWRTSRRSVRS